jgi:hypothetical protein
VPGGHLDGRVEVVGVEDEPTPSTRTVVAFSGRPIGTPGVTPGV